MSRESLAEDDSDEGYSNRYGSTAHQQGAWEDWEVYDEVPEDGLRSAVGSVTGTESSARVELLVGVRHEPHIEDTIRCDEGSSAVSVRFRVMDDSEVDRIAEIENEIVIDNQVEGESSDNQEI